MNHIRSLFAVVALAAFAFASTVSAQPVVTPCLSGTYGPTCAPVAPMSTNLTGAYSKGMVSGTMAAGLAAGSPVFSFRYGGTSIAVIRSIDVTATDITTAFAVTACHLDLFIARAFTASDTGGSAGTLTGNNAKLRTSMATTAISDFRIASTATLSAGTRTLDTDPATTFTCQPQAVAGFQLLSPTTISPSPGDNGNKYPISLATNEGVVIQATVPATGTWNFTVTVTWDEYSAF